MSCLFIISNSQIREVVFLATLENLIMRIEIILLEYHHFLCYLCIIKFYQWSYFSYNDCKNYTLFFRLVNTLSIRLGDWESMERGLCICRAEQGFDIERDIPKWTGDVPRTMQGGFHRLQPSRNPAGSGGALQVHVAGRLGRFPKYQRIGHLGRWNFRWPRSFGLVSE